MRVGMIGTGAISHKHAQAYKKIGFELTVCTDIFEAAGRRFADQWGCEFVPTYEAVCRHPKVDYVDVCTFPDFRLQPLEICAETKKHVQVDCYVKWHRSAEYYSRPIKGSWKTEGGGALINQAIHGIDIMRWLAGPVKEVF